MDEKKYLSDNRLYYMLYEDKAFMKNIYAQLYNDFPDVGVVAYVGANTHRITKDYSINGEHGISKDKKYSEQERNMKNDGRGKASLNVCDSNESSEIREYANIQEIKEMNNMLFYKQMLKLLTDKCRSESCIDLCYIYDEIFMYDKYEEGPDVFVKMNNCCIWLKKEYMDTSVNNMCNVMGKVYMIGYILEEKTENKPRIIKAMAIYT